MNNVKKMLTVAMSATFLLGSGLGVSAAQAADSVSVQHMSQQEFVSFLETQNGYDKNTSVVNGHLGSKSKIADKAASGQRDVSMKLRGPLMEHTRIMSHLGDDVVAEDSSVEVTSISGNRGFMRVVRGTVSHKTFYVGILKPRVGSAITSGGVKVGTVTKVSPTSVEWDSVRPVEYTYVAR